MCEEKGFETHTERSRDVIFHAVRVSHKLACSHPFPNPREQRQLDRTDSLAASTPKKSLSKGPFPLSLSLSVFPFYTIFIKARSAFGKIKVYKVASAWLSTSPPPPYVSEVWGDAGEYIYMSLQPMEGGERKPRKVGSTWWNNVSRVFDLKHVIESTLKSDRERGRLYTLNCENMLSLTARLRSSCDLGEKEYIMRA